MEFEESVSIEGLRIARNTLLKLLNKEKQRSTAFQENIKKLTEENNKLRQLVAHAHGGLCTCDACNQYYKNQAKHERKQAAGIPLGPETSQ